MEYLAILFLFFVTLAEVAYACPDVSGKYKFANEPWNGSLQIVQKGCKDVVVTRKRPVAVSRNYPDGIWTEVQHLKTDARAYVGYEESSEVAGKMTEAFQKVSWKNGGLTIRHFYGAAKKCAGKYAFNKSDCHVTEYALKRKGSGDEFSWTQKGLYWVEGGIYSRDVYALLRNSDKGGIATSMIAANH